MKYVEIFWRTVDEGADPIVISEGTLTHLRRPGKNKTLCSVHIPEAGKGAYLYESNKHGDCQRCLKKASTVAANAAPDYDADEPGDVGSYGAI